MRALPTIGLPDFGLLAVAVLIAGFLLDRVCCGAPPSPRAPHRQPADWALCHLPRDAPGPRGSRQSARRLPTHRSANAPAPSLTCPACTPPAAIQARQAG